MADCEHKVSHFAIQKNLKMPTHVLMPVAIVQSARGKSNDAGRAKVSLAHSVNCAKMAPLT
jgi:hypothetical protein